SCREKKIVKIPDTNLRCLLQCHDMPTSTLSGEAERPKVADAMIEAGFSPPKRTERFNGGMVARLLSHRGLHGPRPRAMVDSSFLEPHEYWLTDFARCLHMPIATAHKWQRLGWVHSRKVAAAAVRWAICADDDELERLRRLRAYKRQWPEPRYPAALTTPKRRDDEPGPCATSCTTAR